MHALTPIQALVTLSLVLLLVACSRSDKPADEPTTKATTKPEEAAAGKPATSAAPAPAASAPVLPVLLLAAEDLHTLAPSVVATGPVISGSLQPERKADLRAEVAAVVQQVLKDNGEAVRAGELLVRLDDTAIRDSLNSAEEAVRASTQAFEQTERQVQRQKTLQAQGMTSTQALEDAEVRRNNAQSDLVAAKARVASARQTLRRTEVRAPFAGVIAERKVSAGDTAQMGKELVKVMDPSSMRFEGLVSADRMNELKPGQPVSFRVNGAEPSEFAGKVKRVDATANATTRQVEVMVAFAEPAKAPRVAGLFAEGRVQTGGTQALSLPLGAVQRTGDAAHVWRVGASALQKVAVGLGERDTRTGQVPVLSGLAAGERVLRNPGSGLRDGQLYEFSKAAVPAVPAATAATAATAAKP
jgi:membrane fusion protein, multidrug efflux system